MTSSYLAFGVFVTPDKIMFHAHSVWGLRWCNFWVSVWMFPPLSSSWNERLMGSPRGKGNIPRHCWSANSCTSQHLRDSLKGNFLFDFVHQHYQSTMRSWLVWMISRCYPSVPVNVAWGQCDPCPTPQKRWPPGWGGPHFKVDIRASALSALHGELRKVFTSTANSSQSANMKEVEDGISSKNLLRVLGKCLGSVQTCHLHWLRWNSCL